MLQHVVACKVPPYRLVFTEVSKNLQGKADQAEELLEPFTTFVTNIKLGFFVRITVVDFLFPLLIFRST